MEPEEEAEPGKGIRWRCWSRGLEEERRRRGGSEGIECERARVLVEVLLWFGILRSLVGSRRSRVEHLHRRKGVVSDGPSTQFETGIELTLSSHGDHLSSSFSLSRPDGRQTLDLERLGVEHGMSRDQHLSFPADVDEFSDLDETGGSSDDVEDDGVGSSEGVEDRASRVEREAFDRICRRRREEKKTGEL